jgi:hypothetical protein|nr:MAG TPA: hypothetical protein [Caudoviricetes sp.]
MFLTVYKNYPSKTLVSQRFSGHLMGCHIGREIAFFSFPGGQAKLLPSIAEATASSLAIVLYHHK